MMKILIATPLYPPDIADPAPYIKELAARLSAHHEVTVLAYNHLPEEVAGVTTLAVEKNQPLFWRLVDFTKKMRALTKDADVVIVENGSSTELPLLFVSLFGKQKLRLHLSDQKITYRLWRSWLHSLAKKRVGAVLTLPLPTKRPEILPFKEPDMKAAVKYESSWTNHLTELTALL